jgi:endonuclease III
MPNFADKVRRLERVRLTLRRRYGQPQPVAITHPVEHALRTILSEEATSEQVEQAMVRIRRHFMDLNDLRVSRPREIRDVLGPNFPRSGQKARVMPRILDQVFKQFNSMVWDFLHEMGKVEARAYFEKLEDVRPFLAAVMARDCTGAHAFPVDVDVVRVLGRLGILDPSTHSEAEMQALLERAVKANRAHELHWVVKRLAEDHCTAPEAVCVGCAVFKMCPSATLPSRGKAKKVKAAAPKAAPAKKKPAKSAGKSKGKAKAKGKAKGTSKNKGKKRR